MKRFFLLFLALLFLPTLLIWLYTYPILYWRVERVPATPVAIVLGASVRSRYDPSPILAKRLDAALSLYHAGKVEKLLLSGDHGTRDYDEVTAMRRYLLKRGVTPRDIYLDHAGYDTYDSLYRAKKNFGVDRAVVVTQDFHLPRALFLARTLGIQAVGLADNTPWGLQELFYTAREVGATLKAWKDVLTGAKPIYEEGEFSLEKDGRLTWRRPEGQVAGN